MLLIWKRRETFLSVDVEREGKCGVLFGGGLRGGGDSRWDKGVTGIESWGNKTYNPQSPSH